MKLPIPYDSKNQLKGIFYLYNEIVKQQLFSVFSTTHSLVSDTKPIQTTYRNNTDDFYWCSTEDNPDIFYSFTAHIHLINFVIRNAPKHTFPKHFKVFGSNNNQTWDLIDEQNDHDFCPGDNKYSCKAVKNIVFSVKHHDYYSYFKFTNIENSYYTDVNYILFSAIEFFGEINDLPICTRKCLIIDRNFLYVRLILLIL